MATYKVTGIIIKRMNLGEADRILTIVTKEKGKIKIVAKGVRRTLSKLAGNLELFCLSNLVIAEGRNLDIVTAAEIKKCFINLRGNLELTQAAFYFAEMIEQLSEENEPHEETFNLLDDVLENLNTIQSEILIPYFEWNLLTELGYYPELSNCLECHQKVSEKEKIYFSVSRGGIVCLNCQKDDIIVSASTVKLLRLFLKHQILALTKIQLDQKVLREVKKITRLYLNQTSDKEFRSQRFLK